jgi:hypothetical protein
MRRAIVTNARSERDAAVYLPDNYQVVGTDIDEYGRRYWIIEGEDVAGWTLEDYVIPRYASGLIVCNEVMADG